MNRASRSSGLMVCALVGLAGCHGQNAPANDQSAVAAVAANAAVPGAVAAPPATSPNILLGTWMEIAPSDHGERWYPMARNFLPATEEYTITAENGNDFAEERSLQVSYDLSNRDKIRVLKQDGSISIYAVSDQNNLTSKNEDEPRIYLRRCRTNDLEQCHKDAEQIAARIEASAQKRMEEEMGNNTYKEDLPTSNPFEM